MGNPPTPIANHRRGAATHTRANIINRHAAPALWINPPPSPTAVARSTRIVMDWVKGADGLGKGRSALIYENGYG
jgi:hypothetical protein